MTALLMWSAAGRAETHWAFQPIETREPPTVEEEAWASHPIDRFVYAQLNERKLKPLGEADRHTLLRRVTFDLVGLPPTPEEISAFLNDKAPDAYEKVVERLLASPRYGERWGR
ncbi:MAG: DUF1549 domain-containing protein, partial [Verrucomicrobiota bacterium]